MKILLNNEIIIDIDQIQSGDTYWTSPSVKGMDALRWSLNPCRNPKAHAVYEVLEGPEFTNGAVFLDLFGQPELLAQVVKGRKYPTHNFAFWEVLNSSGKINGKELEQLLISHFSLFEGDGNCQGPLLENESTKDFFRIITELKYIDSEGNDTQCTMFSQMLLGFFNREHFDIARKLLEYIREKGLSIPDINQLVFRTQHFGDSYNELWIRHELLKYALAHPDVHAQALLFLKGLPLRVVREKVVWGYITKHELALGDLVMELSAQAHASGQSILTCPFLKILPLEVLLGLLDDPCIINNIDLYKSTYISVLHTLSIYFRDSLSKEHIKRLLSDGKKLGTMAHIDYHLLARYIDLDENPKSI